MTFLNDLQKRKVVFFVENPIKTSVLLAFLYIIVYIFYGLAYNAASKEGQTTWRDDGWVVVLILHGLEGLLVLLEAAQGRGRAWPLSMMVIGNALFIVALAFLLHAQLVFSLDIPQPYETPEAQYGAAALGIGFFANAAMVGILWNYFHLGMSPVTSTRVIANRAKSIAYLMV